MPYPPTSRCNSIPTQHWAKTTGRQSEIHLGPLTQVHPIPALTPALEEEAAEKKSLL